METDDDMKIAKLAMLYGGLFDVGEHGGRVGFRLSDRTVADSHVAIDVVATAMANAGYLRISIGKGGERQCRLTEAGLAQYERMIADPRALREFFSATPPNYRPRRPRKRGGGRSPLQLTLPWTS
jgi:hypothetical protein